MIVCICKNPDFDKSNWTDKLDRNFFFYCCIRVYSAFDYHPKAQMEWTPLLQAFNLLTPPPPHPHHAHASARTIKKGKSWNLSMKDKSLAPPLSVSIGIQKLQSGNIERRITSQGFNSLKVWMGNNFLSRERLFDGPLLIFTFNCSLPSPLTDRHCLELVEFQHGSEKRGP